MTNQPTEFINLHPAVSGAKSLLPHPRMTLKATCLSLQKGSLETGMSQVSYIWLIYGYNIILYMVYILTIYVQGGSKAI